MEYRIEQTDPHSGRIKIVRLQTRRVRTSNVKPLVRAPQPAIPAFSEPLSPPHFAPLLRAAEDSSPSARSRRATRRLRRLFEKAEHVAKCQAHLCRADEYELLRIAYAVVRCWQQDCVAEEVERELRAEAEVAMSRASSLFLVVLLRSALPDLDPKRASKWAGALEFADHHGVRPRLLAAFLHVSGGVEGAARGRTKLRIKERSRAPTEGAAEG